MKFYQKEFRRDGVRCTDPEVRKDKTVLMIREGSNETGVGRSEMSVRDRTTSNRKWKRDTDSSCVRVKPGKHGFRT